MLDLDDIGHLDMRRTVAHATFGHPIKHVSQCLMPHTLFHIEPQLALAIMRSSSAHAL